MRALTLVIISVLTVFLSCTGDETKKDPVLYEQLTPAAFRQRISEAPVAYLPLGTIEWHGEHLPLGSDGMQSREFFKLLAEEAGGVVFPMLFLGPDAIEVHDDGSEYYGMDRGNFMDDDKQKYTPRKFDGSCYWVSDSLFFSIIDAALKQVARAGFKLVVAHGHGPSTGQVAEHAPYWEDKYGLRIINCWGDNAGPGMGIMVDHAAMNETSLMMAFYPELVHMEYLPQDEWPAGVGGKDPRIYASRQTGLDIIETQKERMVELIHRELDTIGHQETIH